MLPMHRNDWGSSVCTFNSEAHLPTSGAGSVTGASAVTPTRLLGKVRNYEFPSSLFTTPGHCPLPAPSPHPPTLDCVVGGSLKHSALEYCQYCEYCAWRPRRAAEPVGCCLWEEGCDLRREQKQRHLKPAGPEDPQSSRSGREGSTLLRAEAARGSGGRFQTSRFVSIEWTQDCLEASSSRPTTSPQSLKPCDLVGDDKPAGVSSETLMGNEDVRPCAWAECL
ncbi:hypothetical protein H8959_001457 [Pygathrix nigripes]